MTYEQASVRGLVVRRSDETLLTFRDTVRHHFVASISTLETAAVNREKLLNDFYQYRVTAIEEGRKEPVKEYILPRGRDAAATDKLAGILVEHGIEVNRATAPFKPGGRQYAAGTYVVPMAQPSKRFIRTLLDPETPMDDQVRRGGGGAAQVETAHRNLRRDGVVAAAAVQRGGDRAAAPFRRAVSSRPRHRACCRARCMAARRSVAYLVPWG